MRTPPAAVGFLLLVIARAPVLAQQPPAPGGAQQPPPTGAPQGQGLPPTQSPAPAAAQPAAQPRTFSAPVGLLFNTVRPDRVADFEKVMGFLQAAFEKSTDERVREQARGWHVFKASESGPSTSVLYVYVIDPTVPGADYSLGKILADAYPDQTQLREIWRLYTGSVTGGSLLNLTPVKPLAPEPKPAP